jgi:hypothetical protein
MTMFEIHDDAEPNRPVIARVFTDGTHGRIEVYEKAYERMLVALFSEPYTRRAEAGELPRGGRFVVGGGRLEPWRIETIEHLARTELAVRHLSIVEART